MLIVEETGLSDPFVPVAAADDCCDKVDFERSGSMSLPGRLSAFGETGLSRGIRPSLIGTLSCSNDNDSPESLLNDGRSSGEMRGISNG